MHIKVERAPTSKGHRLQRNTPGDEVRIVWEINDRFQSLTAASFSEQSDNTGASFLLCFMYFSLTTKILTM